MIRLFIISALIFFSCSSQSSNTKHISRYKDIPEFFKPALAKYDGRFENIKERYEIWSGGCTTGYQFVTGKIEGDSLKMVINGGGIVGAYQELYVVTFNNNEVIDITTRDITMIRD